MKRKLFATILTLAMMVGAIGMQHSSAAGTLHQYFWDTSSHDIGNPHAHLNLIHNGVHYDDRTLWETQQVSINGSSSWYGPKVDIFGSGVVISACWYYTLPSWTDSTVIFDITYGSPAIVLWSSGNRTIQAMGGTFDPWPLDQMCRSVTLNGTLYTKFQVRVRVVNAGPGFVDSVKIYKTTWQEQ